MLQQLARDNIAQELYDAAEQKLHQRFESINVNRTTTTKNNGVVLDSITAYVPGHNVSPQIYLDGFLARIETGSMTIDEASNQIADTFENHLDDKIKVPQLDYAQAKEKLYITVINRGANEELLQQCPNQIIAGTDLAAVLRFNVENDENGRASFLVKNEHMPLLQVTENEAFEFAKFNTMKDGYTCRSMTEVMIEDMGMPEEVLYEVAQPEVPMYVITNNSKIYGASGVFIDKSLRQEIYEKVGCEKGFYILPSSVHETLAVPASFDERFLKEMVHDVNNTQVALEEVLSDNVFFCDNRLELHLADAVEELEDFTNDIVSTSVGAHL